MMDLGPRATRYRFRGLTPLNVATNALYRACQKQGGHRKSGRSVIREYKAVLHNFWICAACEVPQRGKLAHEWNSSLFAGKWAA
jgi:hypothetical protein